MSTTTPRSAQGVAYPAAIVTSTDMSAGEVVVRSTDRGAPNYAAPDGTSPAPALRVVAIADSGSLPGAPAASTDGFPFVSFGKVVLYWVPGTAGVASISATVWALTDIGHWVRVGTVTTLASFTEVVVDGCGYRRIAIQPTAVGAGAAGSLNIYVAGA